MWFKGTSFEVNLIDHGMFTAASPARVGEQGIKFVPTRFVATSCISRARMGTLNSESSILSFPDCCILRARVGERIPWSFRATSNFGCILRAHVWEQSKIGFFSLLA